MADIVVKGKVAEATIFENEADGWSFRCSKGAWCDISIPPDLFMEDTIQEAIVHVNRHDQEADQPEGSDRA